MIISITNLRLKESSIIYQYRGIKLPFFITVNCYSAVICTFLTEVYN